MTVLTYLIITGCGGGLLVASMLLGDLFEGVFGDADIDISHDVSVDDGGSGRGSGIRWLSFQTICAFATGFGGIGAIVKTQGGSDLIALLSAIAAGFVMMIIASFIINLFYSQQSTSTYSAGELVGKTARVVEEIRPGRFGAVQVDFRGQAVTRPARANTDQAALARGTQVKVVAATATNLVVE